MKIAATGLTGFLGFHFKAYLRAFHGNLFSNLVEILKSDFSNPKLLAQKLAGVDVLVHLAGQNRGLEAEVVGVNEFLADAISKSILGNGKSLKVVFSSSSHVHKNSPYGNSKIRATEILRSACRAVDGECVSLVFPNIFGEFARRDYNSAVATFCDNFWVGSESMIVNDSEYELLHAQDAAKQICDHAFKHNPGGFSQLEIAGTITRASEVLETIQELGALYKSGLIPNLSSRFHRDLFNTLRSYIPNDSKKVAYIKHTDNRGWLFESVKSKNEGQTFVSLTYPNITRGNHFHTHKVERFSVLQGEARIQMRKLFSNEVHEIFVSGECPVYIDMPTFYTHNITNVGQTNLLTQFWSNEIFDPNNSDTFGEIVNAKEA